uniref:EF-hand calcium binding domain 11 n=1 Tax=Buteo japonicus TaxID=224669 RepID=A0A8C0AXX1_9AVES
MLFSTLRLNGLFSTLAEGLLWEKLLEKLHFFLCYIFEARDEDNKGYLRREDFKVAVVMSFGYKPSKAFIFSFILIFGKFLNLMSAMKAAQLYSNETRKMFSAFAAQDRGFLTFEDFQRAFNSVSPKLSEKNHSRKVDQDSDGRISFKEFESAMKYGQDEVSPVYFA